jgi:hypothetical protein
VTSSIAITVGSLVASAVRVTVTPSSCTPVNQCGDSSSIFTEVLAPASSGPELKRSMMMSRSRSYGNVRYANVKKQNQKNSV